MFWRRKEPGHQQQWYLLYWTEIIRSSQVKVKTVFCNPPKNTYSYLATLGWAVGYMYISEILHAKVEIHHFRCNSKNIRLFTIPISRLSNIMRSYDKTYLLMILSIIIIFHNRTQSFPFSWKSSFPWQSITAALIGCTGRSEATNYTQGQATWDKIQYHLLLSSSSIW